MKKIKLTKEKFAIVDDDDFVLLNRHNWSFYKTNTGSYPVTTIKGNVIYMHDLILPAMPNKYALHINENSLDCRKKIYS